MADADPDSLKQSLAKLHEELTRSPRLDTASRQMLRTALADIERLLQQGAVKTAAGSAPHRLEALAVNFEADHPSLAASLRQFIDLLGRAGL